MPRLGMGLQKLFGSSVVGWIIPTILAIGGILITVDKFRFAEILWGLAVCISLIWLWFQPYRGMRFDVAIVTLILVVVGSLCYVTERYRVSRILSENHGRLIAADDLTTGCPGPDLKTVVVGNVEFAAQSNQFPRDIIRFYDPSINFPISMINVGFANGDLEISATITSQDGRIIGGIANNNWVVNMNNILTKENDDLSSLRIIDRFGDTVLDVRYANYSVIEIRKIVLRYKATTVVGDKTGLHINGILQFSDFCVGFAPGPAPPPGQKMGAFLGGGVGHTN